MAVDKPILRIVVQQPEFETILQLQWQHSPQKLCRALKASSPAKQ